MCHLILPFSNVQEKDRHKNACFCQKMTLVCAVHNFSGLWNGNVHVIKRIFGLKTTIKPSTNKNNLLFKLNLLWFSLYAKYYDLHCLIGNHSNTNSNKVLPTTSIATDLLEALILECGFFSLKRFNATSLLRGSDTQKGVEIRNSPTYLNQTKERPE